LTENGDARDRTDCGKGHAGNLRDIRDPAAPPRSRTRRRNRSLPLRLLIGMREELIRMRTGQVVGLLDRSGQGAYICHYRERARLKEGIQTRLVRLRRSEI